MVQLDRMSSYHKLSHHVRVMQHHRYTAGYQHSLRTNIIYKKAPGYFCPESGTRRDFRAGNLVRWHTHPPS